MKSYDQLKFVLSTEADQFRSSYIVDPAKVKAARESLQRPIETDRLAVANYNQHYLDAYREYDASREFLAATSLDTFNGDRVMPDFDELTEVYEEKHVPFLDQQSVSHSHMLPHQQFWADNGFLLIEGMIDPDDCDKYIELRQRLGLESRGFSTYTPYLEHEEIKRIFLSPEMNMLISDLVGESLGLHFNLSRFTSTERGWHQDEYLNPPETYGRYLAAWVAVDEIPEASGPFEFVEHSHKLPTVSREKVMPFLKQEFQLGYSNDYDWSGHSAMFVNPAYFFKFTGEQSRIIKFLGKKGDVLIWHARLIHRGAPPADRTIQRPGIIGHYSPIRSARWFGQDIRRYGTGGYYWHFDR